MRRPVGLPTVTVTGRGAGCASRREAGCNAAVPRAERERKLRRSIVAIRSQAAGKSKTRSCNAVRLREAIFSFCGALLFVRSGVHLCGAVFTYMTADMYR